MMRLCVSILVAVILTVIATDAAETCDDDQLEISLKIENYNVEFTLKNTGVDEVCFLKWDTLLDEKNWAFGVTVKEKAENSDQWNKLPYDVPVLPIHLEISPSDYQSIKANDEVQVSRDLSDYFSFIQGRHYRVTVTTWIDDCYKHKPGKCNCANDKDDFAEPDFNDGSDMITKNFIAGVTSSCDKVTPAEQLVSQSVQYVEDGTVLAVGATHDQLTVIKRTHSKTWKYFEKAVELLTGVPSEVDAGGKKLDIYQKWFGSYDEDNYNKVLENYRACLGEEDEHHIYAVLPINLCKEVDIASVPSPLSGEKQHFIKLCPEFFTSKTKIQDLIHEMTHDTVSTEDKKYKGVTCYTKRECKRLAANKPNRAINNAENYAKFARDAYTFLKD